MGLRRPMQGGDPKLGVPNMAIELVGARGGALMVREAAVWSMGCGWVTDETA